MKPFKSLLLGVLAFFLFLASTRAQDGSASIGNLRFAQRPDGSGDVDIEYDLSGASASIAVVVSVDGGATFRNVKGLSGDVGAGIAQGAGKRILWRAKEDYPSMGSTRVIIRVLTQRTTPCGNFGAIPGGVYKCGANAASTVTLTGYHIATTHVTKAQWDEVRAWALVNGYTDLPAGMGKDVDHPVVNVSWFDAVKWCNAASEKAGLTPCYKTGETVLRVGEPSSVSCDWSVVAYRLPTWAESEVASSGGTGSYYPWGEGNASHSLANYIGVKGTLNDTGKDDSAGGHPDFYGKGLAPYTNRSGYFPSNRFGLFDMSGNAFQWCWNWSGVNGYGTVDPRGGETGTARITRGGSYTAGPGRMATSNALANLPNLGESQYGFRLAMSLAPGQGAMHSSLAGVLDTEAPKALGNLPRNIELPAGPGGTRRVTWEEVPTATDNLGAPRIEYSHASGTEFGLGATKVIVRAVDSAGNSVQGSFTVTITDPVSVSNAAFLQRNDGSRMVDVSYNLGGAESAVALAVSRDGGATYQVLSNVSGDVGEGVSEGAGKRIVWNAGADYPDLSNPDVKFRIIPQFRSGAGLLSPIPGKEYSRGNTIGDGDLSDAPVQAVQLGGFFMGVNGITKDQWDTVRAWGVVNGYADLSVGAGKSGTHPVTGVSWHDVVKWCNAASEKENLSPCYSVGGAVFRSGVSDAVECDWSINGYRLPTEAEWEVAARGGLSGKRFPWGDTISRNDANYLGGRQFMYDLGPSGNNPLYAVGRLPYTSPVGAFSPNGYGLKDMAGNTWQWCWDWYGDYSGGQSPTGSSTGSRRVVRGGFWFGSAAQARTAARNSFSPRETEQYAGFRVARSIPVVEEKFAESSAGLLDTLPPVLRDLPSDAVVRAASRNGAVVTWPPASALDAAGPATVSYSHPSGSVFPLGTTLVSVTARDLLGNVTEGTFRVTVRDEVRPELSLPAAVTMEATSHAGAPVSYPAATAVDDVSAEVRISYSHPSGSTFALGATPVTVTAVDDAGNTRTGQFTVTVVDTTQPALQVPLDLTAEATGPAGARVEYPAATAEDLASSSVRISYSQPAGTVFPLGASTVTVRAEDPSGNVREGVFTVTVADRTAPVLKLPADLTVEATDAEGAVVSYPAPSAEDAVTQAPEVSASHPSGTRFPIGITPVTVTAVDAAGNRSQGTFTVRVRELRAPEILTQPVDVTVNQREAIQLSVAAAGTPVLKYQWRKNGVNLAGATEPVLRIPSAMLAASGTYSVVVSNSIGSTPSVGARVAVQEAARVSFQNALQSRVKGLREMVVPVTVRRLLDTEEAIEVEVVASSDTLPADAYALPASPAVLRWAAGDATPRTVDLVLREGQPVGAEGASIRLALRNPVGALVGETGQMTVALTSREPGVLGFESAIVERMKSGGDDIMVEMAVRRMLGSSGSVSASVVVAGGSAAPRDYVLNGPAVLKWEDGDQAPKSFTVRFKGTAAAPANGKTLKFELRNPVGGVLLGDPSTLVVLAARPNGTVAFQAPLFTAVREKESEVACPIGVLRSGQANGPASVRVSVEGGTAVEGVDYLLPEVPLVLSWADAEFGPKTLPIRILKSASQGAAAKVLRLRLSDASGNVVLGQVGTANLNILATDTTGPQVAVESPAEGGRLSGAGVVLRGRVSDASPVERVTVALNGGEPVNALLTPTASGYEWMIAVQPEEGRNTATVLGYDARGNVSQPVTRTFTFNGVRPELAGTYDGLLEPAAGPEEIASLRANNPQFARAFAATRGRGLVTLTVTAQGAVTGRLTVGGTVQAFKGTLTRDGSVQFSGGDNGLAIRRTQGRTVTQLGTLSLRLRDSVPVQVSGELTVPESPVALGQIDARKYLYSGARVLPEGMLRVPERVRSVALENGAYTALWDALVDEGTETNGGLQKSRYPQAPGWSRMTVSDAGVVTLVGKLADGTAISLSNRLSPELSVPLYLPLYAGGGFLSGTVVFDDAQAASDVSAEAMHWVRPAGWAAPYGEGWPDGIRVGFTGSKYVAPSRPSAARPVPANPYSVFGQLAPMNTIPGDGIPAAVGLDIGMDGGGLSSAQKQSAYLDLANKLGVAGAGMPGGIFGEWKIKFAPANGTFSGSFRHPVTRRSVVFEGVVFQKQGNAAGGFVFPGSAGVPGSAGSVEMSVQLGVGLE